MSQPEAFTKTTDEETLLPLGLLSWQNVKAAKSHLTQPRERLPTQRKAGLRDGMKQILTTALEFLDPTVPEAASPQLLTAKNP